MAKSVVIDFNANLVKFNQGLEQVNKKLGKFQADTERLGASIRKTFVAFAAGFGIERTLRASITVIADFEQSLSKVRAVTGATTGDMQRLEEVARRLGAETQFSATQAAEGMEFLGRAGYETSKIIAAMPGLLDLAAAGAIELGQASDIASNVLSGFGEAADQTGRVADILAATAASANTDIIQLGDAFKLVAPVAAGFNVSMEETAAAIGTLSNAGLQATRAGTGLRGFLGTLAAPSKKAAEALQGLGISIEKVNPATNSLSQLLKNLKPLVDDPAAAFKVFGKEVASAATVLIKNADAIGEFTYELEQAEGAAKRMSDIIADNLIGDTKELSSAFSELILKMGDAGLRDAIRGLIQDLTEATRSFGDFFEIISLGNRTFAELEGLSIKQLENEAQGLSTQYEEINKQIAERARLQGELGRQARTGDIIAERLLAGEIGSLNDLAQVTADAGQSLTTLENRRNAIKRRYEEIINLIRDKNSQVDTGLAGGDTAGAGGDAGGEDSTRNREAEKFARTLQRLQDRLDPAGREIRLLEEGIRTLQRAVDDGAISQEYYNFLMGELTTNTEAAKRAEKELARDREKALSLIKNEDPTSGIRDQIIEVQRLRDKFKELSPAIADSLAEVEFNLNERLTEVLDGTKDKVDEVKDAWQGFGDIASSALEDAIVEGKKFSDVIEGLEKDIVRLVTKNLITNPLAGAVEGFFKDTFSSSGGNPLGDFFSNLFAPRALGGPVAAGNAYLVGEQGPELFIPSMAGGILSADKTEKALARNVTVNVYGARDPDEFRRSQSQIQRAARRALMGA